MELDYVLLADGVSPRPDGKIDIYGAGFDTIFAPAVPARHAQLSIAIRILLSQHEAESNHTLTLILMTEDGPEVARAEGTVEALPPDQRANVPPGDMLGVGAVLNLGGLIFPTYGRYHLAILWDGTETRAPVRLRVSQMGPPGTAPPGGSAPAA